MRKFSEVYDEFITDIQLTARRQYVIGHELDDVVSEMVACLWKAWKTWDAAKGLFGAYWWSLWLNRRADLNIAAQRLKRPPTVLAGLASEDDFFAQPARVMTIPLPPKGAKPEEEMVWGLLAEGASATDVMRMSGVSKRRYYTLLKGWRTEEVRQSLLH